MENDKEDIMFFKKLSSQRTKNDIELQDIANSTKINIKYLEAIEKGDFDSIPNIYVRLFIRSYADYLNLDSKEILLEYDQFTNTKPKRLFSKKQLKTEKKECEKNKNQKEPELDNSDNDKKTSPNNNSLSGHDIKKNILKTKNKIKPKTFDIKQNYFYSPENIFKIISSLIFIVIVYLLISYLSKVQSENVKNSGSEFTETVEIEIPETDNVKLNEDNFKSENFISSTSERLRRINSPYVFQILTKKKTKLNVSHDNANGERVEDFNLISPKDSLLKVVGENNIYFELWNSHHVDITINNNSIDDYLKEVNGLVRGEFNPTTKNLYLKFYKY